MFCGLGADRRAQKRGKEKGTETQALPAHCHHSHSAEVQITGLPGQARSEPLAAICTVQQSSFAKRSAPWHWVCRQPWHLSGPGS